jgi:hypothetical protein
MKKALLGIWRAGITPLIQMHDEAGFNASSRSQVEMVTQIMVEAVPLVIPVVVDAECGPSWGRAKYSWDDCEAKFGGLRAT